MKNIEDLWSELGSLKTTEPRIKLERGTQLNCYLSLLKGSNTRCFEIHLGINNLRTFEKKFYGVEVYLVDLGKAKKSICIYLLDSDLEEIFTLFIEDLLRNIQDIKDGETAFIIIQGQFHKWGKLFAQLKGELLSKESQRGLYGELTFLKMLLDRSSDLYKTMKSWTGPDGSNQDFSNKRSAVEVKSSKATKPSVNIASELQLDWTNLDGLFLCVFHMDELSNGSETLNNLVQAIKKMISHDSALSNLFELKLDRVGISVGEEENYTDYGFIIRSQKAYKVSNGFPALTKDTLDNEAIHNVKYQIDLTACEPFEVPIDDVITVML